MKKVLMFLGGVFVIVIVVAAIAAVSIGRNLGRWQESGKDFTNQTVREIAQDWDPQALVAVASPELLEAAPLPKITELSARFKDKLGWLERWEDLEGGVDVNATSTGVVAVANFRGRAHFSNGEGVIRIRSICRDDEWRVLEFRVESPLLE